MTSVSAFGLLMDLVMVARPVSQLICCPSEGILVSDGEGVLTGTTEREYRAGCLAAYMCRVEWVRV